MYVSLTETDFSIICKHTYRSSKYSVCIIGDVSFERFTLTMPFLWENISLVISYPFILHLLQRKPVSIGKLRSMEAVNAALTHLKPLLSARLKTRLLRPPRAPTFRMFCFCLWRELNIIPPTEISVCYRIRAICPTLERINVD